MPSGAHSSKRMKRKQKDRSRITNGVSLKFREEKSIISTIILKQEAKFW